MPQIFPMQYSFCRNKSLKEINVSIAKLLSLNYQRSLNKAMRKYTEINI